MARVRSRPIRSKWSSKGRTKTVEDQASAVAFIAWRLSHEAAINLHGEDFVYRDDDQRLNVIGEFLAFLTHVVDRRSYQAIPEENRERFINGVAQKLAEHMQDNRQDWQGPGDYRTPFFNLLNQRFGEYAEETFDEDGPGYSMYRHLGHCVQAHMQDDAEHANRWAIDQVMDIEGKEIYKRISKSMDDLLSTGSIDLTPPTELEDHIEIPKPGEGVYGED